MSIDPQTAFAAVRAVSAPTTRGRILLVDDEAPVLRAYSRLLRQAHFEVDTLAGGEGVLERVAAGDVDVVVTDLRMRGVNGIEVLRRVRTAHPDLPVIVLTGGADLPSALEAMEHGALRYLMKPIDGEVLSRTAEEAVRVGRLARMQRAAYELQARQAIADSELEGRFATALRSVRMAFQPIVRAGNRAVFACEALVRNDEPSLCRPDSLFAAAERVGGVHDLGRLIRRLVASAVDAGRCPDTVFVNLHPRDLDDPDLYDGAAPLGAIAGRVVLEITERDDLDGIAGVPERVKALRALGYRVALDDLGAGYAGLTSFAKLSPDIVKLDMSLVRGIDREPTKRRIVQSMIAACRDLGILVVGEGVETDAESDVLTSLRCDLLQGYLFGRPQ